MEETFFDTPLYREFAQLDAFSRLPDESTILRFGKTPSPRHRLEKHKLAEQILVTVNDTLIERGLMLKAGTVVDANVIAASPSTKNIDKTRDPQMHSSKKGQSMVFRHEAHTGADADSGLVHTVRGTSGHVSDIAEANTLSHGQESVAFGDAGYQGVEKRPDARAEVTWHVAMRPGKRKTLNLKIRWTPSPIRLKSARPESAPWSSTPGHQAPVRLCQSALPVPQEEHCPTGHVVCTIEFVEVRRQMMGTQA